MLKREEQGNHREESDKSSAINTERRSWLRPVLPQLLQSFFIQFFTGLNDGNLGIILPDIKSRYDLTQSTVSIIFLCNASGFAIAAFLNGLMIKKLTQAKTLMIGAAALVLGFIMLFTALPFPALCVFYVFVGFGVALTQSGANVFVGELPHATMMLNFLHASYGLGALVGPFAASAMLQYRPWNYSYLVLSSLATFNLITCAFTFRHLKITEEQGQDDRRRQIGIEPDLEATAVELRESDEEEDEKKKNRAYSIYSFESATVVSSGEKGSHNILAQTIRYRITYVGALYLLVYVGIEVTFGELAYTFLISERSHDHTGMAHLVSGFWTGLCVGRICLGYVTLKLGEKRMIYLYISVLICMCITFWLVEIVAVDAVALVMSGIALGPLFPTILSVARKCVPCHLYATTVGFLCAFGSCGSALFPYLTGVLMNSTGPRSMPPLTLAMSCTILIAWFFIPDPENDSVFKRLRNYVTGDNNPPSGL